MTHTVPILGLPTSVIVLLHYPSMLRCRVHDCVPLVASSTIVLTRELVMSEKVGFDPPLAVLL